MADTRKVDTGDQFYTFGGRTYGPGVVDAPNDAADAIDAKRKELEKRGDVVEGSQVVNLASTATPTVASPEQEKADAEGRSLETAPTPPEGTTDTTPVNPESGSKTATKSK